MIPEQGDIDVLVTVKAAPQPSSTYGETVCVAGIYVPRVGEGRPELIRLYPVPYQYLQEDAGFGKYDLRTFRVRRNPRDSRAESRRVELNGEAPLIRQLRDWKRRADIVEEVPRSTMCELNAGTRADMDAASLGVVDVADAGRLEIFETPPLSKEKARLRESQAAQQELNLFNESARVVKKALELPPLSARLHYRCTATACKGHAQGVIDWEFTAMQFREMRQGTAVEGLRERLTQKFFENPFAAHKQPAVYVGNQENPRRRTVFSVLGMYYPPKDVLPLTEKLF